MIILTDWNNSSGDTIKLVSPTNLKNEIIEVGNESSEDSADSNYFIHEV